MALLQSEWLTVRRAGCNVWLLYGIVQIQFVGWTTCVLNSFQDVKVSEGFCVVEFLAEIKPLHTEVEEPLGLILVHG